MGSRVQIDAGGCILGALLLLTLRLDWLLSAVAAAAFHECCHAAAIALLGGSIRALHIGAGGTVMDADIPGTWQELLSAAAGPVGSFLLLTLCHIFPKLAICAFIQGVFNLLPLYPLDGGRILHCLLMLACPERAETLQKGISVFLLGSLLLLVLLGTWLFSWGMLPIVAGILMILGFLRKRPCKRRQIRVQ